MKFEKPKIKRVYVTISDPDGKESTESFTIYDATPKQVAEKFKAFAPPPEKRNTAQVATA